MLSRVLTSMTFLVAAGTAWAADRAAAAPSVSAMGAQVATQAGAGGAAIPLDELLRPDGTLDLESGRRGSVTLEGWRMEAGEGGAPRFVPAGERARRELPPGSAGASVLSGLDDNWSGLFQEGTNGPVYALAMDGNGHLYVGGDFTTAGPVAANSVAKWNGTSWSALGSGMNSKVYALAVDGSGNVYAGGVFTTADEVAANYVAKWNGTNWSALGSGMNTQVLTLAVDGSGNVYAGGSFSTAGGVDASRIAKWNGTSWSALGSGTNDQVRALAVDGSGNVYAGGWFTTAGGDSANRIAKWDGTSWSALGSGLNYFVSALALDGSGNLYAGGGFSMPNSSGVAKWNGTSWSALGSGTNNQVRALAVDGSGNVYAGGHFTRAGGVSVHHVAKWDGTSWSDPGYGVNNFVGALAVDGFGNVYAGGEFAFAGGSRANRIAKWDRTSTATVGGWSALGMGMDGTVNALAVDGIGGVYAGGLFLMAGNVWANRIGKWDGASWSALGLGMNSAVYSLAVDGSGNVYACGAFTMAGGVSANKVAKWNGTSWSTLGLETYGGNVFDVAVDGSGNVYACGLFTWAGIYYIAKWDGTSWSALGSGMNTSVFALAVDGSGNVYAGGGFTTAGGDSANRIAKWDGTSWSALGSGMNNVVNVLAVDGGGNVYAGGDFTTAGGDSANRIAKWDGTSWSALGSGVSNSVYALAVDGGGNVYAGGEFTAAGQVGANYIAKWNGTNWSALGSGMNNRVYDLALVGSRKLYVGGVFTTAGGKPSNCIGLWHIPASLTITASAGAYGTISPSGAVSVDSLGGQTFTITPNPTYLVADVLVDGVSVGAVTGYTFTNVTAPHTIAASFAQVAFRNATTGPLGDTNNGFGVAWGDYDGNGDEDLYLSNYGQRNKLFRNDGGSWADATTPALADSAGRGTGVAWGDYDNDGDLDLFLSNDGGAPNRLFRNDGGGAFVNVATSPLTDSGNHTGVAWGDYDNDGDLDLYQVNWNSANKLFRNDCGTWVNATSGPLGDTGQGRGVAWGDYDNDGDLDLYLANNNSANKLFRNEGGGVFVDATSGPLGITSYGQGVAWGDYDNDGNLDLFLSNGGQANKLFRNEGGPTWAFVDATSGPLGTARGTMGVAWGDYDNDGDLDLYLANNGQASKLFRNDGGGTFVDATLGPEGTVGSARGVAWGDYDNDGDLDLYLANYGQANKLFRNDNATGNHWLQVKLRGVESNRSGIGARVRVVAGGVKRMQEISGGSGLYSQNSLVAQFGLGATSAIDSVVVRWPSGIVQVVTPVPVVDQQILVVETGQKFVDATSGPLGDSGSGRGVAWGDYDGDGDLDLYVSNYGSANKLLRNDCGNWVDVTTPELADATGNGMGVAWGDYNNDGNLDLYVANTGQVNRLFRNKGDGTFDEVASLANVADAANSSSSGVAWVDYDKDGRLDLYVANGGTANRLYRSQGDGTFVDVATGTPLASAGDGMSVVWGDYNNDGWQDLYLANWGGPNKLLRNNGAGSFVDVTTAPLNDAGHGTGAAWGDYDGDGNLDLYLANFGSPNHLFRNVGGGVFVDVTNGQPLAGPGSTRGVVWWDYDHDGDLDLYQANDGYANRLCRNDGGGVFVNVAGGTPLGYAGSGQGVACGDYDNDGDQDLYLVNYNGQANKLFRNLNATGNHWLHIDLVGTISNRAGIGARVKVVPGGVIQIREISGGSGLHSQNSLAAEFGLGAAMTVYSLEVRWPSGVVQTFNNVAVDRRLAVVESCTGDCVPTDVTVTPEIPSRFALHANVPNPFNPVTRIGFDLPESQVVGLRVYDVSGRLVRTLVGNETYEGGSHSVLWNGEDDRGQAVASGVYLCRLSTAKHTGVQRMVLLR